MGLAHLKKTGIIHCDLKPENVMFTNDKHTEVKIVDFGSACTDSKTGFKYVQSRFYRCPEIVMGLPYDNAVDMWSFGCILCELSTGRPIFPACDENELLEFIRMRIGMPPISMI
jgi:serine/threonine protein kinase